jgi:hypothetical protein
LLTLSGASRSAQKKVVCRVFKPPHQLRMIEATSGWRAAARPTDRALAVWSRRFSRVNRLRKRCALCRVIDMTEKVGSIRSCACGLNKLTPMKTRHCSFVVVQYTPTGADSAGAPRTSFVLPNVRAKLPAEAGAVSLVRDDAPSAADQAYSACRSGSA